MISNYSSRVKKLYNEKVVKEIKEKFNFKSPMQVPKLLKICINQGLGIAVSNSKFIEIGAGELSLIAGQKAIPKLAKKSVSNFKLREGTAIGVMVTLRGLKMYDFLDRFITVAIPRIRDFSGLSPSCFDGQGNCTIGIKEQVIFPEISMDRINKLNGMNITFVTNTNDDRLSYFVLKHIGIPFIKSKKFETE